MPAGAGESETKTKTALFTDNPGHILKTDLENRIAKGTRLPKIIPSQLHLDILDEAPAFKETSRVLGSLRRPDLCALSREALENALWLHVELAAEGRGAEVRDRLRGLLALH